MTAAVSIGLVALAVVGAVILPVIVLSAARRIRRSRR
jgi:hypothetical protein